MVDTYLTLWAKKELVYATDAAPTGAANAVLCFDLQTKPFDIDQLARKLDRPVRGGTGSVASNARRQFSYKVELAGSGVAGTAPAWMELNEACGMAAATLTAATSAEQKFAAINTNLSSLTQYHWVGPQRRRGVGARGDISAINLEAGKIPYIEYAWTEMLHPGGIDNVAPVGSVYTRWIEPVEVNAANTIMSVHGFAVICRSLDIKVGAQVDFRDLPGKKYVARGNHEISVDMLIELPDLAAKDYFAAALTNVTGDLGVIHGLVAGNIIELDSDNFQITDVKDASEGQVAMVRLTGVLKVNLGQDDLIITAK